MTYQAFRRSPVPQPVQKQLQALTFPAPTRGLVLTENESYMQPGAALVLDNWKPTLKGIALRGGCVKWCDVHALDAPAWANATLYNTLGVTRYDAADGSFWNVAVSHTSAASPVTFAQDRFAHPTFWVANTTITRQPLISGFEFASGSVRKMYAANATKLFDVTANTPVLIQSGQSSGNYVASQLSNQSGDHMLVCNDVGDYPLHFDGTTWTVFNASQINASAVTYPGASVAAGHNLTYVWKYRNRYFFIEGNSMNAWYLPLNSFQGALNLIPLQGAATKGGKLLFGATWSVDAGDGIDDKCVFVTDLGEIIVFTGPDPGNSATAAAGTPGWHQEGRYSMGKPMGMNAHIGLGGDLLIATVDGITPTTAAISKDSQQLELAMITQKIKPMWRDMALGRNTYPWTMKLWGEYGGMFVTWPGGTPGNYYLGGVNTATGAWTRYVGWDVMCMMEMRGDMFFGTQAGRVMQMDRTGYDDGVPYVASMVGGWETFQAPSAEVEWMQARAAFVSSNAEPFQPQLTATVDYNIIIPSPPAPGPDPGTLDVWDQGNWGPDQGPPPPPAPSPADRLRYMQWDQPAPITTPIRNTGWVSIGMTGFAHAPIVQVTVAQQAKPDVELVSVTATYNMLGVNV